MNDLRKAKLTDLKIGLKYYSKSKKGYIEDVIREKLDIETTRDYLNYKHVIKEFVKQELIYVKANN